MTSLNVCDRRSLDSFDVFYKQSLKTFGEQVDTIAQAIGKKIRWKETKSKQLTPVCYGARVHKITRTVHNLFSKNKVNHLTDSQYAINWSVAFLKKFNENRECFIDENTLRVISEAAESFEHLSEIYEKKAPKAQAEPPKKSKKRIPKNERTIAKISQVAKDKLKNKPTYVESTYLDASANFKIAEFNMLSVVEEIKQDLQNAWIDKTKLEREKAKKTGRESFNNWVNGEIKFYNEYLSDEKNANKEDGKRLFYMDFCRAGIEEKDGNRNTQIFRLELIGNTLQLLRKNLNGIVKFGDAANIQKYENEERPINEKNINEFLNNVTNEEIRKRLKNLIYLLSSQVNLSLVTPGVLKEEGLIGLADFKNELRDFAFGFQLEGNKLVFDIRHNGKSIPLQSIGPKPYTDERVMLCKVSNIEVQWTFEYDEAQDAWNTDNTIFNYEIEDL